MDLSFKPKKGFIDTTISGVIQRTVGQLISLYVILEPSPALNQVNDQDDDGNYEKKMDQTAANVTDEAKKPEDDQDDNYSPEHGYSF
jgi:hypothetical protein